MSIFAPETVTLSSGAIMPEQLIHAILAIAFVSVWALVGQIVIRSAESEKQ